MLILELYACIFDPDLNALFLKYSSLLCGMSDVGRPELLPIFICVKQLHKSWAHRRAHWCWGMSYDGDVRREDEQLKAPSIMLRSERCTSLLSCPIVIVPYDIIPRWEVNLHFYRRIVLFLDNFLKSMPWHYFHSVSTPACTNGYNNTGLKWCSFFGICVLCKIYHYCETWRNVSVTMKSLPDIGQKLRMGTRNSLTYELGTSEFRSQYPWNNTAGCAITD